MNLDHYTDQPKLRGELHNRRPGTRSFAHIHQNPFYVFWLLLLLIWFCVPAFADNPKSGDTCQQPGISVSYPVTTNNPDGSKDIVIITCDCIRRADGSAVYSCHE
jgi:hypothetical protein